MRRWRRRVSADMDQATGLTKTPAVGAADSVRMGARSLPGHTPGAGEAPPFPAPAPGHHRGHHMVIDVWECGCIHTWTPATGWNRDFDHIDDEIRRLLTP